MKLNDKIKGALYGYALGDALGLGTEFMNKFEVKSYYPGGLRHFDQMICDAHRSQWNPGDWTNDTETLVRFFETILKNGHFDIHELAETFKKWYEEESKDLAALYRKIMLDPDWTAHPIPTTHRIWMNTGNMEATNEALGRALVTAIIDKEEDLMEHTRQITLLTHDDSRCVSTGAIIAKTIHSLLWKGEMPEYAQLESVCNHIDPRTLPYLRKAKEGTLEEIDLDDEDTQTYTRKSMAGVLWTLWHCDNAADMIHILVDEGGDSDTNASLAGAIAGIIYGYDALPAEKEKLTRKDYLDDLAERLTAYIEKNHK